LFENISFVSVSLCWLGQELVKVCHFFQMILLETLNINCSGGGYELTLGYHGDPAG